MSETEEAIQSVLILMSNDFGSKMNICYSMILYTVYYLVYYKYKYRLVYYKYKYRLSIYIVLTDQ